MWYKKVTAQRTDPFAPVGGGNQKETPFTEKERQEFYNWAKNGGAASFLKQREDRLNNMQQQNVSSDTRDDSAAQPIGKNNIPQANTGQTDPVYYKKDFTLTNGYINYNRPDQWGEYINGADGKQYTWIARPDISPKKFSPYDFTNTNGTYGRAMSAPTPIQIIEVNQENIKRLGLGLSSYNPGTKQVGLYLSPQEKMQLAKANAQTG